jgi:transposase-like protein
MEAKFEVVRDAPRWRCAKCKNTSLELAQGRGKTYVWLICPLCEVTEGYSKEDWERAMQIETEKGAVVETAPPSK